MVFDSLIPLHIQVYLSRHKRPTGTRHARIWISLRCINAMISQYSEDVFINLLRSVYNNAQHSALRLTRRRPAALYQYSSTRHQLSTLSNTKRTHLRPSIRNRTLCASSNFPSKAGRPTYATNIINHAKSDNSTRPREIAVLGAGITGLTTAHYLARHATNANITVYEAGDRPGGWVKADQVEVEDEEGRRGQVLFQHGPRMLRSGSSSLKYDDLVLYDVVSSSSLYACSSLVSDRY